MKRLYHYPVMLVLSILSILSLIVLEATAFIQFVLFQPDIYLEAMSRGRVDEVIYNDLVDYFTGFSGPTGIPPEIFIAPLNKDELYDASKMLTADSIVYLTDPSAAKPTINYDFSKVENYVDAYIEQYTDHNGIPKDETYYNLVKNTNATIESQISGQLDVTMLYTLSGSSYAATLQKSTGLIQTGLVVSGIAFALFFMMMIIIDRRHPRDLPYWFGVTLTASSIILLAPAMYLNKINYFDNFFMRSDNVYKTVTSICGVVLNRVINGETMILICGVLLILSTIIIHMFYIRYLKNKHRES